MYVLPRCTSSSPQLVYRKIHN